MNRTKGILVIVFTLIFQPCIRAQQEVAGRDINQQLIQAAEKNDKSAVEALLEAKADVNAKTEYGRTALMQAAFTGATDALEVLIAAHADVNAKDREGDTALIVAAGADADVRDKQGSYALMQAAWEGHADVVKALLEACADPCPRCGHYVGMTAAKAARARHHDDIVELFKHAKKCKK